MRCLRTRHTGLAGASRMYAPSAPVLSHTEFPGAALPAGWAIPFASANASAPRTEAARFAECSSLSTLSGLRACHSDADGRMRPASPRANAGHPSRGITHGGRIRL